MEKTPRSPRNYLKILDQQRGKTLDDTLFQQFKDFLVKIQEVLERDDGLIQSQNRDISLLADKNLDLKAELADLKSVSERKVSTSEIEQCSQMAERMKLQSGKIARQKRKKYRLNGEIASLKSELLQKSHASASNTSMFSCDSSPNLLSRTSPKQPPPRQPPPLQTPVCVPPVLYKKEPHHSLMTKLLHQCNHTGDMRPQGQRAPQGAARMEVTDSEIY